MIRCNTHNLLLRELEADFHANGQQQQARAKRSIELGEAIDIIACANGGADGGAESTSLILATLAPEKGGDPLAGRIAGINWSTPLEIGYRFFRLPPSLQVTHGGLSRFSPGWATDDVLDPESGTKRVTVGTVHHKRHRRDACSGFRET